MTASGGDLRVLTRLGTSRGIDTEEIIAAVHSRRAPTMSATAGLRL
jgi:hypothetical protein